MLQIAAGRRPTLARAGAFLGLATLALAAGAGFVGQPLAPLAAAGGLAYLLLCFARPQWGLAAFAFVHLAVPVYIRLPPVGPLPPAPVALAMLVALAAATLLSAAAAPRRPWLQTPERRFLALLLLFDAIALLSLADERTTVEGVNMWFKACLFPLVVLLIGVRILRDAADVDRLYRAMLAASCLTAAYAVFEFAIGRNPLLDAFQSDAGLYFTSEELGPGIAYRAFSVFTQPIEFGTCLGMVYPYALVRFATARTAGARLLWAAAGALCALGVALTFSRGAMLAIAVTSVGLGIALRELRPWLVAALSAAALGLALAWPWLGAKVADRVGDVDNVTLRFKLWETAVALFGEHPFRGIGIGNYPQYQADAIRRHEVGPIYEFGADSVEKIRVVENTYLQLAAETGVIGVVAFAALLGAFFALLLRTAREAADPARRGLALGVGAGAVAYLVNGLTITAYTHYVSTLLLIGFLFAAAVTLHRTRRG